MKKRILKGAFLLTLSGLLFSCSTPSRPGDSVSMTAKITNLGEKLEVEVIESPYTFGVHWVITDSAEVFNKNGEKITVTELHVGDTVEILYSGQVMLSYPPQIVAAKIAVL